MNKLKTIRNLYKLLIKENNNSIFSTAEIMTPLEFIEKYKPSGDEQSENELFESVRLYDIIFEAAYKKRMPKPPQTFLTPEGDIKAKDVSEEDLASVIKSRATDKNAQLPSDIPFIHGTTARDVAYKRHLPSYKLNKKDLHDRKEEEKILVVDENEEPIDLVYLAKKLTDYSNSEFKILKQNTKMIKSTTGDLEAFYNIGIPAIMGLVYDEKQNKFIVVNTCPSAGSCMHACYATKGGYVQYQRASERQNITLNFLYNRPEEYKEKAVQELLAVVHEFAQKNIKTVIRWHDSGDFYSSGYMDLAIKIIDETKAKLPEEMRDMIHFYAYTKRAEMSDEYKGKGLLLRKSVGATPAEERKIHPDNDLFSQIIPKEVKNYLIEKGVIEKDEDEGKWSVVAGKVKELKDIVLASPKVKFKNKYPMLTMHEYEVKEDTEWPEDEKVNVIILPGENDRPAKDSRVAGVYLMFH